MRYKPENMYLVGVISNPPKGCKFAYYQHPLIQDLKLSWECGIFISQTAKSQVGRVVRAAVAGSINDLLAQSQAGGTAGPTAKIFCPTDYVWKEPAPTNHWKDLYGRTNFEHPHWQHRNIGEWRRLAYEYQDTTSYARKARILSEYGIAWSEMFELSYYDPPKQVVAEGMHNLLEGLIPRHVCKGLQLEEELCSIQPVSPPAFMHPFKVLGIETMIMKRSDPLPSQVYQIQVALTAAYLCNEDITKKREKGKRNAERDGDEEADVGSDLDNQHDHSNPLEGNEDEASSIGDTASIADSEDSHATLSASSNALADSSAPDGHHPESVAKASCQRKLMAQHVPALKFVLLMVTPKRKGQVTLKKHIVSALLAWVSTSVHNLVVQLTKLV